MLQSIRDRTQGWIAGIIITLLILSFGLWGIHSYFVGGDASNSVATVNGVDISKNQLTTAYERMRRQLQMQFNSSYELPPNAEVGLKDRALHALINIEVLKQASLAQNFRISSQQVDQLLQSMPEFQADGHFSMSRFNQVLATTLYSAGDFLDLIKTTLLIDQPRLGIIFTSYALPDEVTNSIALIDQERDVQYAMLTPIPLASIQINNAQIKEYYQKHTADFKTPEQVSVDYLELNLIDLAKKIQPSLNELKNYYNENMGEFKTTQVEPFEKVSEKVKAAYIHQKAEEQFADVREKLANLTYEHPESLKHAADALGLTIKSTPLFTQDKTGQDIAANAKIREAAFSNDVLNLQNNSDVLQKNAETAIVLRVKAHELASIRPLAEVQPDIIAKLKASELDKLQLQQATQLKTQLESNSGAIHLSWNALGFVSRHTAKVNLSILDSAFSVARPNENKPVYAISKLPDGYAVVRVSAVRDGKTASQSEHHVFAEQFQNTQGLLEYELYKQSLMNHAKIQMTDG